MIVKKYFRSKKQNWPKSAKIVFFESKNDVFEQKNNKNSIKPNSLDLS